ncbi:MAG: hypothetical protein OEU26_06645 [Candidatus Tectomicrobia bacterium]|nr:hypothetical protein [Candidatus Tectomicrobia bacterium]
MQKRLDIHRARLIALLAGDRRYIFRVNVGFLSCFFARFHRELRASSKGQGYMAVHRSIMGIGAYFIGKIFEMLEQRMEEAVALATASKTLTDKNVVICISQS